MQGELVAFLDNLATESRVAASMVYTHLAKNGPYGVRGPLDR